jgi:hypothetical protein
MLATQRRRAATLCVAVSVSLATGALTGAAPASAAGDPPRVEVVVRDGHVRSAPDTLRPGLYRFAVEVTSRGETAFQLVRPRAGYTAGEYARDAELVGTGTSAKARRAQRRIDANARMWGGVVVDGPTTEVFWQSLPAGRVLLVTPDRPSEVHVLRVKGDRRRTSVPAATAQVDVGDGTLTSTSVALPTSGTLQIRNTGTRTHLVGMAKLAPGKTAADVVSYVDNILGDPNDPNAPAPEDPFDSAEFGAAATYQDPGTREWLRYDVTPGNYVVFCYQVEMADFSFHLVDQEIVGVTVG